MAEEKWLPVVGYEDGYEISNKGQIRSLTREVACFGGSRVIEGGPRVLSTDRWGYNWIALSRDGVRASKWIHRLVLEAFVGPCPDGKEADHRNEVRDDNRLMNLRWYCKRRNVQDATSTTASFISPDGELIHVVNVAAYARSIGVNPEGLYGLRRGRSKTYQGYRMAPESMTL